MSSVGRLFSRAKKVVGTTAVAYKAPESSSPVPPPENRRKRSQAGLLNGKVTEENADLLGEMAWLADIDESDLMLEHLFEVAEGNDWFDIDEEEAQMQLMTIRAGVGQYVSRPLGTEITPLELIAQGLNCDAAMLMCTDATRVLLDCTPPTARNIVIGGEIVKLVDNILPFPAYDGTKVRGICFVKELDGCIIWNEDASTINDYARKWDEIITRLVFSEKEKLTDQSIFGTEQDFQKNHKNIFEQGLSDEEAAVEAERPTMILWPMTVAVTFIVMGALMGTVLKEVVIEFMQSKDLKNLLFLITIPLVGMMVAFFLSIISAGVFQIIGPINHMQTNSRNYSAKPPTSTIARSDLPHVTIHCPVYKEDLWDVIDPTIQSCRTAIATYQAQGGTASILVADDGAQLRSAADQHVREEYYRANDVAWTARRPHGQDGYLREGLFKKASNLNHCIRLSEDVERRFQEMKGDAEGDLETYNMARKEILAERNNVDWATGDLSLGSLVLIIDSDTRIPVECILSGVLEMRDSPEVGILQHTGDALIVSGDFWEMGMAHFIRMVFFGIRYTVAGGDLAPFLGHNAFLRWSAVAEVAREGLNGELHWWSEDHVSEDFELAMRLQTVGYSTRLASYFSTEFLEGVSLTVYDEIARWTKYAWGCSELMFNPFKFWFSKGPFGPIVKAFLKSKRVPVAAKCSSLFYMWTYWIIASSWIYCVVNFVAFGWFTNGVNRAFVAQFDVLVAVCIIFGLHDAIVIPFAMWRLKEAGIISGIRATLRNFWLPIIFFQGLSVHLSKALLAHLFNAKMTWGSTSKSVENRTLVEEMPKIWRNYKVMFILCGFLGVSVIVLAVAVPPLYRIDSFKSLFPIVWMISFHLANPFVLHAQSYLSELLTRVGRSM
ncbi:glycosyl transferase family group 2-domain-containing protein [Protomyces lactucae-debilis]|uniref:Glycosyl transferase family group 2-domain-containing protein n=1 Tax=Protomyces lactucae-debilis TaxID=2754530 RepID=A0A1Y2FAQ2_PROLT|nr:glycosyl transferase family group 2-domain-containing protein [Protomyces lactucae-debilis]ORY80971.1 glycosyl transferase family group 2-domain-containing protein [Protomyces lactucae-debilis]